MGLPVGLRRLLRSSNEQGSILLITIVSVAVVALLGLAVYDLALIEGQFSAASVIDYRAYEIAQAGIERGIRELRNLYMNAPPGSESFARVTTTCSPSCTATGFHLFNVPNTTIPSQSVGSGPFAGAVDPGGTYTLEVKYVTIPEANNSIDAVGLTYPFGLECIPDSVFQAQRWCANLAFLRSTGVATDAAGNTRTRTIQTLVRATSTSPWTKGIVAGNGNPAVSGEVLIAGSVEILGGPSAAPALSISGGSNAGMVNNWYPLVAGSGYSQTDQPGFDRLTPKQQLICPPGVVCLGGANLVESLGAEIKIAGNVSNQMVNVSGGTPLGQSGATALYGSPQRRGKGPLDGVYIAAGCLLPCIGSSPQPFNSGASVIVDRGNLTKPYPTNPPSGPLWTSSVPGFPILNGIVTISDNVAGTDYGAYVSNWFAPHTDPGSGCGGCSARIVPGSLVNTANCAVASNCNGGGLTLDALLNKLQDSTLPFRHQFVFKDRVSGANRTAEICWRRGDPLMGSDSGANLPASILTLEFGFDNGGLKGCENPSFPSNPVLLWLPFPWGIDRSGGPIDYSYRGAAVIVTSGGVQIDGGLQSYCGGVVTSPCTEKFPENHLLAIMATGNIDLATIKPNVSRIMGYFFASANGSGTAKVAVGRDVKVIGVLRGDNVCFSNLSGCSGVNTSSGIPGFFQASFLDPRKTPNELPAPYEVPSQLSGGRWQVTSVPQFWKECRRGPADTLPATPSGICGYDQ
jgi:hypothetical protein